MNLSPEEKDRFDKLSTSDQLKLEKIFSMMQAEKNKANDPKSAVIDKAGNTAAFVKGEMAENGQVDDYTEEIAEARVDRDVAERIEGMLSIPLKRKFLDAFMDLWQDLIEEDPFFAEDVINHLNNEMHKEIDGYQAMGDRLAGMEEGAMQPGEGDLESGETGNMDALTEEISENDIIKALKAANAQDYEIKVYMKSLKKAGDKFDEVDDYVEDFMNYVADKSLQEHFNRFMFKKYS